MKNLAIILGITNYEDPDFRLPACANDVKIMEAVLRTGGRFSDVITVRSSSAEALKSELADTVTRFAHDDIDNLLFYFSGHGDYVDDDFLYQLADYRKDKSSSTSLSNKYLDGLLRNLNPALIIKIVDACNSGIAYVKDGSNRFEYLSNVSKGEFPKCYFYFSSQNDQKSYADDGMSDFTKAFALSIVNRTSDDVRYTDIMESISDFFKNTTRQMPEFVVQAAYTDIFGTYSNSSKDSIRGLLPKQPTNANMPDETSLPDFPSDAMLPVVPSRETLSIADYARQAASRYVTFSRAKEVIATLRESLLSSIPKTEIDEIYSFAPQFYNHYSNIPNPGAVGKWLKDNKDSDYFAEPTYGFEEYKTMESMFGSVAISLGVEPKTVTKKRKVIDGITTSLSDMSFICCSVSLNPSLPNLLKYSATLTFILSKTNIEIFYCFTEFKEVAWSEYEPSLTSPWERVSFELVAPETIDKIVGVFYKSFSDWAIEKVQERLKYRPDIDYDDVTPI